MNLKMKTVYYEYFFKPWQTVQRFAIVTRLIIILNFSEIHVNHCNKKNEEYTHNKPFCVNTVYCVISNHKVNTATGLDTTGPNDSQCVCADQTHTVYTSYNVNQQCLLSISL